MTEKQLIEGCWNGERLAQKELYETYSRKMMGVCLRYVSDRETARDLLQDGFVKVFTSMDSYSGLGSFGVDAKDLCQLCVGVFAQIGCFA
jgi:DNA-directed RNA polymerase specialized sigma24 family protein